MKRVVAYCRVSTDKDEQINSLESQKRYFEEYIKRIAEWTLVSIYADEGKSGTSTKKRTAFNRMIADAEDGKFDLVITKEISRFARNTLDSIYYTRKLKDKGVGVLFMNDNINTLDPDSELRMTIMSSIAQEESRKTSERVKWGQRRQMERGVAFGNTVLGYTIKNGRLHIKEPEAEYVRRIFHKYLDENKGLTRIAKELETEGVMTSRGNKLWDATAVLRILKNEKYCGILKQKKSYTLSYLTHVTKQNNGEEEFVIINDNHEPIVSRDTFERTQAEIVRRGVIRKDKGKYTNRYAFSGKIRCGICGAGFISRMRKSNDGKKNIKRWQCSNYFKYGCKHACDDGETAGCENIMIREEIIESIFMLALKKAVKDKDTVIENCYKILDSSIHAKQDENEWEGILREIKRLSIRKQELVALFLDRVITKAELQSMGETIDRQSATLQEKAEHTYNNAAPLNTRDTMITDIRKTVSKIIYAEIFSEEVVKSILDKIVVYSKNKYEVHFTGLDGKFSISEEGCNYCHESLPVP